MYSLIESQSVFHLFQKSLLCFSFVFSTAEFRIRRKSTSWEKKRGLQEDGKGTLKRVLCFFDEIVLMCSRWGGRKEERESERTRFFLLRTAMNKPWSHSALRVWGLLSLKDISFQEGLEIKNRPWRILSSTRVQKEYLWHWDGNARAKKNMRRNWAMQTQNRNTRSHRDDSEDYTADLQLEELKSLYFCTGLHTELNISLRIVANQFFLNPQKI